MSVMKKTSGIMLAAAAAAMFSAGAMVAPTASFAADGVKCVGANSCKGHSACKTATSSCKGLNACKGQGWVSTADAAACTAAGGKAG